MGFLVFRICLVFCFILIIIGVKKVVNKAQKKHNCSFDEFNAYKTEIPVLLWIRGILGFPAYFFLFEWFFNLNAFQWAYVKSTIMNWIGFFMLVISTSFLLWAFYSIKTNYHGTMGLHKEHELVTTGAYKYIRHPIEVAFLLVHISVFLLTSNWILGLLLISLGVSVCILRAPVEEKYMEERFGDTYLIYKSRTGKFIPKCK